MQIQLTLLPLMFVQGSLDSAVLLELNFVFVLMLEVADECHVSYSPPYDQSACALS